MIFSVRLAFTSISNITLWENSCWRQSHSEAVKIAGCLPKRKTLQTINLAHFLLEVFVKLSAGRQFSNWEIVFSNSLNFSFSAGTFYPYVLTVDFEVLNSSTGLVLLSLACPRIAMKLGSGSVSLWM